MLNRSGFPERVNRMGELPNNIWMGIQWMDDKRTEAGWKDIRQNRKVHSFYWIREGKGTFVTDREIAVRAGMLFYLKPGLPMSMESDADDPLRITMVLLKLLTIHADDPLQGSGLSPDQPVSQDPVPIIPAQPVQELDLPFLMTVDGELQHRFDSLFHNLTSGWVPGQPAGELRAKAVLHQLLYDIVQLQYSSPAAEAGPELFKKIKEELEREYAKEIRLKAVAERYGISVSHLREMFHRYLGTSPKSYLDQLRNEHAKKRLIYTDLPVREIAESCGYADEYHFSKRFKQGNGIPPLQFRKLNR